MADTCYRSRSTVGTPGHPIHPQAGQHDMRWMCDAPPRLRGVPAIEPDQAPTGRRAAAHRPDLTPASSQGLAAPGGGAVRRTA